MQKEKYLIVIGGPTAIGKSQLAIDLAKEFNCEILSADSRQFYREMSIGTAKPSEEEMQGIKHHFINNISINDTYNVGKYEEEALQTLHRIYEKNNLAILVGGSGLFINAILYGLDDLPPSDEKIRNDLEIQLIEKGLESLQQQLQKLDPEYYQSADMQNPRRVVRALEVCLVTGKPYSQLRVKKIVYREFKTILVVLNTDREILYNRINQRVDIMMQQGLLEEVKNLTPHKNNNALQTVGYKELFDYLNNQCTLDFAVDKIKQNSRNYAKRQITWFKKNEEAKWFEPSQKNEIVNYLKDSLA